MIPIRFWRMALGNICPKASDRDVEVSGIRTRYVRDTDNNPTSTPEGYNLSFLCLKGFTQTVKLPLTVQPKVEEIEKLLAQQAIVRVKFIGLNMRAYAMMQNGEQIVGISATAQDVEITSTEAPEIDDIDVDFS